MGKTIRQLSEQLKISKQAVQQRMDNIDNFRKKHTHKIGNRLEIDDPGVKLIVNFDNKKRQAKGNRQVNIDNILLKQLDVKDQQITKGLGPTATVTINDCC